MYAQGGLGWGIARARARAGKGGRVCQEGARMPGDFEKLVSILHMCECAKTWGMEAQGFSRV